MSNISRCTRKFHIRWDGRNSISIKTENIYLYSVFSMNITLPFLTIWFRSSVTKILNSNVDRLLLMHHLVIGSIDIFLIFVSVQIQENINLFTQARNNILTILNEYVVVHPSPSHWICMCVCFYAVNICREAYAISLA